MSIKLELVDKGMKIMETNKGGIIVEKVKIGKKRVKMVRLYVNGDMERLFGRLGEKNMAVGQVNLVNGEVRSGDLGMKRKGESRKLGRKISKMGTRDRGKDTRIFGKGRKREKRIKLKRRAGRRVWSFEERLEEAKKSRLARKCLKEIKERAAKGRVEGRKKRGSSLRLDVWK